MYKRDFAILILSCVALLIALQQENSAFSFRKAWYQKEDMGDASDHLNEAHDLPSPLVADLNGDGSYEVIKASQSHQIHILKPMHSGKKGDGFLKAQIITSVSLLYKRVLITAGRRPVSMAVGYLDPLLPGPFAPRKQVLVVLTASWQVICFDHNLKLLWEVDIKAKFPHHSHLNEVAVYISPHQVRQGDRGLVIVGASLETGDMTSGDGLEGANTNARADGAFSDSDILMEEMRTEEEALQHSKSAGDKDKLEDVEGGASADTTRHFSYYAMEGGSGHERWHHSSSDFHHDLESLAAENQPQNNYKLEADKAESRHFGEASCRDYRESVLHSLPHSWTHKEDSHLHEAHFIKHKHSTGSNKASVAQHHKEKLRIRSKQSSVLLGASLKPGSHPSHSKPDRAHHGSPDGARGGGILSFLLGPKSHDLAHAAASTSHEGRHHHGGAHTRHQGHVSSHKPGAKGGGGSNHHWDHHSNMTANSIVAHLEDGVEVIHLFTGRPVCKLHLPSGSLHADLNGDGIVDHVQVFHGTVSMDQDVDSDDNSHHPGSHCIAVATSGIPPREKLWRVNVCKSRAFMSSGTEGLGAILQDGESSEDESAFTEILTPVMLPLPDLSHGYRSRHGGHGLVVFATSKGRLSAVSATGHHIWQTVFPGAGWPHESSDEAAEERVVPSLSVMALHKHGVPTTVVVAGKDAAVLVSEHGHLMDVLWLPNPPVKPLIVADFNGDGLNDIIVVTRDGIYGYVQVHITSHYFLLHQSSSSSGYNRARFPGNYPQGLLAVRS